MSTPQKLLHSVAFCCIRHPLALGSGATATLDAASRYTMNIDGHLSIANNANTSTGASPNLASNQILLRTTLTGDMNGDGKVNSYDITLLNTPGFYNKGAVTNQGVQVGDLNGDGKVNSKDVTVLNTAGKFNNTPVDAPAVRPIPVAATAGNTFAGNVGGGEQPLHHAFVLVACGGPRWHSARHLFSEILAIAILALAVGVGMMNKTFKDACSLAVRWVRQTTPRPRRPL